MNKRNKIFSLLLLSTVPLSLSSCTSSNQSSSTASTPVQWSSQNTAQAPVTTQKTKRKVDTKTRAS